MTELTAVEKLYTKIVRYEKISAEKYCKRLDSLIEFANQDGLENLKGKSIKTLMEYWTKAKVKVNQEKM